MVYSAAARIGQKLVQRYGQAGFKYAQEYITGLSAGLAGSIQLGRELLTNFASQPWDQQLGQKTGKRLGFGILPEQVQKGFQSSASKVGQRNRRFHNAQRSRRRHNDCCTCNCCK